MPYLRLALASTLAAACLAPSMSGAQVDRPEADGFETVMGTGTTMASACTQAKIEMRKSAPPPNPEPGQLGLIGNDGCDCQEHEVEKVFGTNVHDPWTCQLTFYYKRRPMPWE